MTVDIRTAAQRHVNGQVTDYAREWFADGAVWGAERVTPTREQIAEVLRGIGLSDLPDEYDSSIHSWRCEHPETYGPCDCFQELVRELAEVERAAAAKARGEALIEAVQAHRNLHRAYASTSVCYGGIGGQAMTPHCAEICDNHDAHQVEVDVWHVIEGEAVEYSRARAAEIREEKSE